MVPDDLWSVLDSSPIREITPTGELGPDAFIPRPYQMEDISAARAAWSAARAVLYRAATGLGKATVLATLAATTFCDSRTLCVVNTVKLANQLRETFARQLGWRPGLIGGGRFDGADRRVVIAVIQSLYSTGRDGQTRVERTYDPGDFGLVLIDECLVGETLVTMADGSTRRIEDIVRKGGVAAVRSFNHTTGRVESRWLVGSKRSTTSEVFHVTTIDGKRITCTPNHLFYTQRGYVPPIELLHTDRLLQLDDGSNSAKSGSKRAARRSDRRPNATRSRHASRRRLHDRRRFNAGTTLQVSEACDRALNETGGARGSEVSASTRRLRLNAAHREELRMGRRPSEVRHVQPNGLRSDLSSVLPRGAEARDAGMAEPDRRGGAGVVVHGRRLDVVTSGGADFDGGIQPVRARADRRMVSGAVGYRSGVDAVEARTLHHSDAEGGRAPVGANRQAASDSVNALQVAGGDRGDVQTLRADVPTPRPLGRDALQRTGLSSRLQGGKGSRLVSAEPRGRDRKGDSLQGVKTIGLASIVRESKTVDVYDVCVEGNHNFFANGVLVHNCEGALAEKYAGVIRYFLNGNPDLKVLGCTATPIRGDGVGMGALFDHVEEREDHPLNRGPLWAFQQGYLVTPRQRFVKCSADFTSINVRKSDSGESDYSDEQLGKMLADDKHLIEMAQGVIRACGDERAIVIAPNSTDLCDAIADYLNAQRPGSARAVHGNKKTCPNPDAVFDAHRRGEFQLLVGVNMLTTGYDDPAVRSVFILRPTKSQRLFTQIIGRAFRPDETIARTLGELRDPVDRRALIAASPKPYCNVYCLVGVSRSTRDMTIADMIRGKLTDAELERVKEKMLDGAEPGEDGGPKPERSVSELVQEVRKEMADDKLARERRRLELKEATISIRDMDDGEGDGLHPGARTGAYETLRRMGYKDKELDRMGAAEAGEAARREIARLHARPPLCSRGQRRILEGRGVSAQASDAMPKSVATRVIDAISKAERWGSGEYGSKLSAAKVQEIVATVAGTDRGAA